MRNSNTRFYLALILCIFLFLTIPKHVVGDCTCEPENEERNKPEARKYKIGAIASILIGGTIGVCIPILGKSISALHPEKNVFFIIKAFAAGVILSTGFIHVLPDAFENLTSPCLKEHPWGDFPFTGFIAMVAAIGTLMVDTYATSYYTKANNGSCNNVDGGDVEKKGGQMNHDGDVPIHTHASHGHSHGAISSIQSADSHKQLLRDRVTSQVLELGIIVHSVIIGISLGASENPKTIRPLVAALTFHQFFEGMGIGGCIAQAKFKVKTVGIMALFFSLTTPIGIGIGMGISSRYDEDSPKALIVEGVLNSASAGILIYMALVDLLAADFMHPKVQTNGRLQLSVNVSLLLGAGCMALLAKWA